MNVSDVQYHRMEATLEYQFPNLNTNELLTDIEIKISGKTGRIKHIVKSGNIIFSLRPTDGFFIPTFEGGLNILDTDYRHRFIMMNKEAAPFIASGKSAFCKHVMNIDETISPMCEILIIDEQWDLLAVGTAVQPAYAIEQLQNGIAAKVRHYRKNYVN